MTEHQSLKLGQEASNRFEFLGNRVMQRGERSGNKVVKDRREILRKEKAKRGVVMVSHNITPHIERN